MKKLVSESLQELNELKTSTVKKLIDPAHVKRSKGKTSLDRVKGQDQVANFLHYINPSIKAECEKLGFRVTDSIRNHDKFNNEYYIVKIYNPKLDVSIEVRHYTKDNNVETFVEYKYNNEWKVTKSDRLDYLYRDGRINRQTLSKLEQLISLIQTDLN